MSWPPNVNELGKDSRRPPETILNFYWYVITSENYYHNGAYDSTNFLSMSFSEDLFYAIFNGTFFILSTIQ